MPAIDGGLGHNHDKEHKGDMRVLFVESFFGNRNEKRLIKVSRDTSVTIKKASAIRRKLSGTKYRIYADGKPVYVREVEAKAAYALRSYWSEKSDYYIQEFQEYIDGYWFTDRDFLRRAYWELWNFEQDSPVYKTIWKAAEKSQNLTGQQTVANIASPNSIGLTTKAYVDSQCGTKDQSIGA